MKMVDTLFALDSFLHSVFSILERPRGNRDVKLTEIRRVYNLRLAQVVGCVWERNTYCRTHQDTRSTGFVPLPARFTAVKTGPKC